MKTTDILQHLGIDALNDMQDAMLKAYEGHDDLVLLSPTGTGKTLAYLLPLVQTLRTDTREVQAVVLVPSRELALQTEQVFRQMGTGFRAMACYGGRPAMEEHRSMKGTQPAVIIGTPGRLNDHLQKGNFSVAETTTLVIDEFDKSLELGFHDEMSQVISQLPALQRRVLLSATDSVQIPQFTGVRKGVSRLDFRPQAEPQQPRTTLHVVHSPVKDKLQTLLQLLCQLGEQHTLVFVGFRESAERVTGYLQAMRFPCDMFHGGMEQPDRERSLYRFRNGSCPVLVCTDLAARGLDIPIVDNIVHYHLPANEEAYIHRNGRTARWDATGQAYIILHPEEALPPYLPPGTPPLPLPHDTPRPPKPEWTTIYIGKGKRDKLNKVDIVGFLYKKGNLARQDVGTVDVKDRYAFAAVRRNKVAQLLRLIGGEKIKGMKTVIEEAK